MPDATTTEWVAAAVAAGLIVFLTALHLVRLALRQSRATRWGRLAGFLLAALSVELVLCVAIAAIAAVQADTNEAAVGTLAGELVHPNPKFARQGAEYAAAVLLPFAVVVGVVAVAVVAVERPSGLRAAAGGVCAVVLTGSLLAVRGDPGGAVTAAAWTSLVLAAAAAAALLLDELGGRHPS